MAGSNSGACGGVMCTYNALTLPLRLHQHTIPTHPHIQTQTGMVAAARPQPGLAGRDINLLVNHFSLGLRINSSLNVYSVSVSDLNPAGAGSAGRGDSVAAAADTQQQQQAANGVDGGEQQQKQHQQQKALPRGLLQRVLAELASQAGWPDCWVLVGRDRLASTAALTDAVAGAGGSSEVAAAGDSSSSTSSTSGVKTFTVKLLPGTGGSSSAAGEGESAALLLEDVVSSSSKGGTFKVRQGRGVKVGRMFGSR